MSHATFTVSTVSAGPADSRLQNGDRLLPRLLVVDDEADIREPLAQFLAARGFAVSTASSGVGLQNRLAQERYDLVLMDVNMPGDDGFTLCRAVQASGGPPVILLTARADTADRVTGLDTGADDYVVKPFEPSELLARIRSVLRRAARPAAGVATPPAAATPIHRFRFAGWVFDRLQHELVHEDGRAISLSASEGRLLHAFALHPNEVLSREKLLDLCASGEAEADVFDRSIDSQVSRLRRKVELEPRRPRLLKTAWGNGYMLASSVGTA